MNDIADKIPTEVVQLFTARQAWEYRLVPFRNESGTLRCYAGSGKDYSADLLEIEVLSGFRVEPEYIDTEALEKLLSRYYRQTATLGTTASPQSPVGNGRQFLIGLIEEAFSSYASDIHFEPYEDRCRIRFRMDGRLLERYVIDKANYPALVNQVKIMSNLDISEKRLPQDGRIAYEKDGIKFDVRVSSLPTIYGEKVVLRLLTRHVELLELDKLGFTARQIGDYTEAIRKPHGLILISGPTGSGKSTTLYATLRRLNEERHNILTIEDPVEYTLEGVNQVQLKEEIGLTFTSALRTFLRQDPDIIMLGEIRDADTAQMAIRSSLTGHLIFSTLHTNSAWGCISRLIDMGINPYLISNTLVMCLAQRLVRLLCPSCKQKIKLTPEECEQLQVRIRTGYKAKGCEACYYTGYKGRKAIYEVIPIDAQLSECVRAGQGNIASEMAERGIISLREAAIHLFEQEETSLEELIPFLEQNGRDDNTA